jgi:choline-sulfatase
MRAVRANGELPEDALRDIQAVYYGMVTKVESLIGRILDELRAQGLMDSTVVLFTSDHGDFAGQYGLFEKWDTCLADCLLRVPCILTAPGLPAGRCNGLSEHTDFAPTLLDLLGLKPDWGVHGASLLPVVRGGTGKTHVFADGGHEQEMWPRFNFSGRPGRELDGKQRTYREHPETMARAKMVRSARWKLVVRLVGGNELYDLAGDPQELVNLWPEIATRPDLLPMVAELQQALIEWSLRTDTDRPYQEKVGA